MVLINNSYTRGRLLKGMMTACSYYDTPFLLLGNLSLQSRHPDQKGQEQIYQTVLSYLRSGASPNNS